MSVYMKGGDKMISRTGNLICAVTAILASSTMMDVARAQVPLSAYTDANGFIDVQALTCAQLANTYQEDADYLAVWWRSSDTGSFFM